ncbi:Phosphomevalonate kinase [Dentipellis sp. KUC8613]|nr:Phosphomevalonate kinase [Dentipellis sp. KUC8613]
MATTLVSAPGKVLLAGGYLVLDPAYSGVVVSTSSRFYTVVQPGVSGQIRVRSPQFVDGLWTYTVAQEGGRVLVAPVDNAKNKFVHLAIQKTFALAYELKGPEEFTQHLGAGIDITIAGDNDFYSQQDQLKAQGLPSTVESLAQLQPFVSTGVAIADVSKTGLGSSAALITSLVSALLVHFGVIPRAALAPSAAPAERDQARRLAHNVAQFVHCLAQGKVGSGFDVAAAVFGSQLYTRFTPSVIKPLMDDAVLPLFPTLSPQNPEWDYNVQPFKLPPFTRLLLADVHAGSNTPSLVSKVLKWRQEDATTAHSLWTALDQLNTSLGATLLRLSDLSVQDPDSYLSAIRYMTSIQSVQWLANPNMQDYAIVLEPFYEVHLLSEQIRAKMREMGALAGVEIEPPQQTKLLDDSIALGGVIGGGVPGAGGYDAVWLLVCDPPASVPVPDMRPLHRVEHLWQAYGAAGAGAVQVAPLMAQESARGVEVEELEAVPGLAAAVALGLGA